VDGAFDQVRRFIGFQVLGLCEPARLFMVRAVVQRRGGGHPPPFGGARYRGEREARGVQRSETPGDAGRGAPKARAKREAR